MSKNRYCEERSEEAISLVYQERICHPEERSDEGSRVRNKAKLYIRDPSSSTDFGRFRPHDDNFFLDVHFFKVLSKNDF